MNDGEFIMDAITEEIRETARRDRQNEAAWMIRDAAPASFHRGHSAPQESRMAGRFDYVRYDDAAAAVQRDAKAAFQAVEGLIESQLKTGRAKALALTALEEAYMWVGKQIRDDQLARGGDSADQPKRSNE